MAQAMTETGKRLIDTAIGFLVPYLVASGLMVIFKGSFDIGQIFFFFILPILFLIFPFATLSYNPLGVAVILAIAGAFYVAHRYVPEAYRRYAIGLIFVGWGVYGIYCGQWIVV